MNKTYNKERHIELLKYSQYLKKKGKFIGDESQNDYLELLSYSAIQANHLNWETQDHYLKLLKKFEERKIDISDFCIAFCKRSELNNDVSNILESNLILLAPHSKSGEFAAFIEQICDDCEVYSGDPEPFRESYEIGDIKFRASVEKIFLKMQKYLDE